MYVPKKMFGKKGQRETKCNAFMSLAFNRVSGKFEVHEIDLKHNHLLYLPQTRHLMVSQRKSLDFQAFEIDEVLTRQCPCLGLSIH
jgi:zinc finger SWIM domain-containing protein 3